MQEYQDRMAQGKRRRGRPRKTDYMPEEVIQPDPPPMVRRCPQCGAARIGQWQVISGVAGDYTYERCKACAGVFYIQNGRIRRVR